MGGRVTKTFERLKVENKSALITYVIAGDPDLKTSQSILEILPAAGADIIELGIPFTDPMADGPAIQAGDIRALAAGSTLSHVLGMVRTFRSKNDVTPVILMGYFNPIYQYGLQKFSEDAAQSGVDGVLVVDLPPEEDGELKAALKTKGLDFIRLITPTSDNNRLAKLVDGASGFLYYVSIAGVTGTASVPIDAIASRIADIRQHSDLPVAVGFGIRTPEEAEAVSKLAEGVVIGSAFVTTIEKTDKNQIVKSIDEQVKAFKAAFA